MTSQLARSALPALQPSNNISSFPRFQDFNLSEAYVQQLRNVNMAFNAEKGTLPVKNADSQQNLHNNNNSSSSAGATQFALASVLAPANLEPVHLGYGTGGDCSLLPVAAGFCDTFDKWRELCFNADDGQDEDSDERATLDFFSELTGLSVQLRQYLASLAQAYDSNAQYFPCFKAFLTDVQSCMDLSDRVIVQWRLQFEDFLMSQYRIIGAAVTRQQKQHINDKLADVESVIRWRAELISTPSNWLDDTDWLFVAAVIGRPIVILQAIVNSSNNSSSSTNYSNLNSDLQLLVSSSPAMPDATAPEWQRLNFKSAFFLEVPLYVGFVASGHDVRPDHYVAIRSLVSESGNDGDNENNAAANNEASGSPESNNNSVAVVSSRIGEQGRSRAGRGRVPMGVLPLCGPSRAPFSMSTNELIASPDISCGVKLWLVQMESRYHVDHFCDKMRSNKAVYRCRHTKHWWNRNRKSVDSRREAEASACPCVIVFHKSSGVNSQWKVDMENSNLTHTCPAAIAAQGVTVDMIRARWKFNSFELPHNLKAIFQQFINMPVSKSTASRARQAIVEDRFGSVTENFSQLTGYLSALKRVDSSFYFHIVPYLDSACVEEKTFERMFFAAAYLRQFVQHCIPVVVVDGTHSRHELGGIWYFATGILPSHRIIILAAAFCAAEEDYTSWKYFLDHLKTAGMADSISFVIISDRRAGAVKALNELYPLADKVACSRHVGNNAKHHAGLTNRIIDTYVNQMAKSTTEAEYCRVSDELKKCLHARGASDNSVNKLLNYLANSKQWADDWSFAAWNEDDNSTRFGFVTSNAVETVNSVFCSIRMMPITAATQHIVDYMHKRYRQLGQQFINNVNNVYFTVDVPNPLENPTILNHIAPGQLSKELSELERYVNSNSFRVEKLRESSVECVWQVARDGEYSRVGGLQPRRTVKWNPVTLKWSCTCRYPNIYGIPCKDVLMVIRSECDSSDERRPRFLVNDAVHEKLKIGAVKASLAYTTFSIESLDTHDVVPHPSLLPHPKIQRKSKSNNDNDNNNNSGLNNSNSSSNNNDLNMNNESDNQNNTIMDRRNRSTSGVRKKKKASDGGPAREPSRGASRRQKRKRKKPNNNTDDDDCTDNEFHSSNEYSEEEAR